MYAYFFLANLEFQVLPVLRDGFWPIIATLETVVLRRWESETPKFRDLSVELIRHVGHRREIQKMTFRKLVLRQNELKCFKIWVALVQLLRICDSVIGVCAFVLALYILLSRLWKLRTSSFQIKLINKYLSAAEKTSSAFEDV